MVGWYDAKVIAVETALGKGSARAGDDGVLNVECVAAGNRCCTATSMKCGIVPLILSCSR